MDRAAGRNPEMDKVSIVIPVYNMEGYLGECLDSVLTQTHRDIEAICVDDGSTDGTPEMLAEYAARDPRVRVIAQKNAGSGPARNAGIAASTGRYLMFLDPDDLYKDGCTVEKLCAAVRRSGLHIARGRMVSVSPDGKKTYPSTIDHWPPAGVFSYRNLQSASGYCVAIYDRDFIRANNIEFPAFRRFQDPPFHIKAMVAAGEFLQIDDVVYWHRRGYKKINWKGNGGFLLNEQREGIEASMSLAREHGLRILLDMLLLMDGRRAPGWGARFMQWLCRSGCRPSRMPFPDEIDAWFDVFSSGKCGIGALFPLARRVVIASPGVRRESFRVLCAHVLGARRSGLMSIAGHGCRRGTLLALLVLRAWLADLAGRFRRRELREH